MGRLAWLLVAVLGGCPSSTTGPSANAEPVGPASVPAIANVNDNANVNANGGANAIAAGDPAPALAAAMAAAGEARGATPCERAFDGYRQMKSAVERAGHAAPAIAEHDRFVATCASLPATVQSCLELRWALQHPQECQDAQARLDPAQQAKLQTLIVKERP